MLESIKKLRYYTIRPDGSFWPPEISGFIDEIEREISERYIPRPVDANGEPWGEADKAFYANGENFARRLAGFSYASEEGRWLLEDGDCCTFYADECRHANSDPIKELLEEFGPRWVDTFEPEAKAKLVCEYAAKLREAMGGDES